MENAIVCAAKHFIGFELCKELLNGGCDVVAIENEKYLKKEHFEKWLEIGRNANLYQRSIEEIQDQIDSPTVCYIPYIDFGGFNSPDKMNDWMKTVESLVQVENITEYIIIFPSQYCYSPSDMDGKNFLELFRKQSRKNIKVVEFYVPTLYGPWQPNTYLFQQLIEGKQSIDYVDDPTDAIYIEDAVIEILEGTRDTVDEQKILLKNVQSNVWENCIRLLNETFSIPEVNRDLDSQQIHIRKIQERMPYQEGLALQIECFKRVQE